MSGLFDRIVQEFDKQEPEALSVLEALEAIGTTRNPKIEMLQKNANNVFLRDIFRYTYDWTMTYGVSAPVLAMPPESTHPSPRWTKFAQTLDLLAKRGETGGAANVRVKHEFGMMSQLQQKWYQRVMQRDLQIRVSVGTINKIWPALIPEFDLMLANVWEGEDLQYPVIAEPKLDGLRIVVVFKNGVGHAFSRGAKEYESLDFIVEALRTLGPQGDITGDCVFDGEVYCTSGWNETISLVKTHPENLTAEKKQALRQRLSYYVFDWVDGKLGQSKEPLVVRRARTENFVKAMNHPNVKYIQGEMVNDKEELMEAYEAFLQMGFEGMMIKKLDGLYVQERSDNWLKFKPEQDEDVEILELIEGKSPNTIGKLGQVKVRTKDNVQFYVGSGFSFSQREQFWKNRDTLVGTIIEIKCQKDSGQNVAKARFPIFKRLREDRRRGEFSCAEAISLQDDLKGDNSGK